MRDRLPVCIENNDLPSDNEFINNNNINSYGYVNILYLVSMIITVASVIVVIFLGNR